MRHRAAQGQQRIEGYFRPPQYTDKIIIYVKIDIFLNGTVYLSDDNPSIISIEPWEVNFED